MNNIEFSSTAKNIATNYKTLYILGCFGAPLNNSNKQRYTNNYGYNKNSTRKYKILNSSSDTFGFDCVCLIKGILWGWNGNVNATYGGASYAINGVPDVSADGIMNYCVSKSNDFSNIELGEIVHIPGHVGIYIGDGLVVECTPIWKDGVQITTLNNIGCKNGYNGRFWKEHGKLKFINYVREDKSEKIVLDIANEVIKGLWSNGEERKKRLTEAGYNYQEIQDRVNSILGIKKSYNFFPKSNYVGVSIVDALAELNIDFSYNYRKKIALANGIENYKGSASQNIKLLQLLKEGNLKKPVD